MQQSESQEMSETSEVTTQKPSVKQVSRTHPGGDVKVTDWMIRGTLHRDGVEIFPFGNKTRSIDIISFTVHNCNAKERNTRCFTYFVSFCISEKEVSDKVFDFVQRSTTVMGLEGCYVCIDSEWYHVRLGETGVVCDYSAVSEIAGHSQASSNAPCVWCNVEKRATNPLIGGAEPSSGAAWFPGCEKCLPSSLEFVNSQSAYRCLTLLSIIARSHKGKAVRGLDNLFASSIAKKELDQVIRLLSHIVQEYSFRLPLVLSPTVRMHYQCDQLEGALKSLGLLDITEESIVHGSSDSDSINYPSKKRYRREVQGYPANETVNSVLHQYPSVVQERVETEKKKRDHVIISQYDNTVLHPKGFFLIDYMHILSNVFIRINRLLAGELPEVREKRRAKERNWVLISNSFFGSGSRIAGKVGNIVNAMAVNRLKQCSDLSWMSPSVLLPAKFTKLTCEQRILFYLNYFKVIYQDSLDNQIVRSCDVIIDLIGEFLVCRRDRDRMAKCQARLSFYLGLLEEATRDDFPAECVHILNHLFTDITFGGEKSATMNFATERMYRYPKKRSTPCADPIRNIANWMFAEGISSALMYSERCKEAEYVRNMCGKRNEVTLPVDWKEWVLSGLLADSQFRRNDSLSVETLIDAWSVGDDVAKEWKKKNLSEKYLATNVGKIQDVYGSITWRGTCYRSARVLPNEILKAEAILENKKNLAFKLGHRGVLLVFLVIGYQIVCIDNMEVPMAICRKIPVHSMGDEAYTYHKVWTKEISSRVALVPVDHLFFGMGASLISGRKIILVTNKVLIFQFRDLMNVDRMKNLYSCLFF